MGPVHVRRTKGQKQRLLQQGKTSKSLPVEWWRSRTGGERVGVTEGAERKISWRWALNHCQVECVVHARFDCEALQSIIIVSNAQHRADVRNCTAMGILEIGRRSIRRRRGGLEQECKQRLHKG